MKINKGFTLIELLAVIVILAIITLIATPLILSIIDQSKKGAFKSTAQGIIEAAELSYAEDILKGNNGTMTFTYTNGVETSSIDGLKLNYKGTKPRNGTVSINSSGKIALAIHDGKYCAEKDFDKTEIIITEKNISECKLGSTPIALTRGYTKAFGGSGNDLFHRVAPATDGYVVVGESDSSDIDMAGLNKGETDAIIIKYDLNGNIIWKKSFGGTEWETFKSVVAVSDGFVAVGIASSNDIDMAGFSPEDNDGLIVKFDLNGNVVWKKTYNGSYVDEYWGVTTTSDGFVAVGRSNSVGGEIDYTDFDSIIVKYDFNGNVIWEKIFGGDTYENFIDVVEVGNNYIVVGETTSVNGDLEGLGVEITDALVVKYDSNGNIVWKKIHGGEDRETFYSICLTDDGFIASGDSSSIHSDFPQTSLNDFNGMLVKYDFNGNVLWKDIFGGSDDDSFSTITAINNGYVIIGTSYSTDGDLTGLDNEERESIIVKYNISN